MGSCKPSGVVHHIDLTVSDLPRSTAFYESLLPGFGFRREPRGKMPVWTGSHVEIGLQLAPGIET